jgi:hypothetical protein
MMGLPIADDAFQHYARAAVESGTAEQWRTPGAPFRLELAWEASAFAEYEARDALGVTTRVWPSPEAFTMPATWETVAAAVFGGMVTKGFLFWKVTVPGPAPGLRVPFNPATMRGAAGTHDLGLLISEDRSKGVLAPGWEFVGLRPAAAWEFPALEFNSGGTFEPGDWVFGMCVRRQGGTLSPKVNASGCGRKWKRHGLLTPGVIAGTEDPHGPISVVGFNLETGPLAVFWPDGATRVEHPQPVGSNKIAWHPPAPDRRLIPQGLILTHDLSNFEITQMTSGRPEPLRTSTRRVWELFRDRGFRFGAETGGGGTLDQPQGGPIIETTPMADGYPDSAAWRALGFRSPSDAAGVFSGFPWSRVRVAGSPQNIVAG